MTKPELSDIERNAFFKKAELQRGSEHTILFHHLRVGRELPLVRVKRLEDDLLKVTENPRNTVHGRDILLLVVSIYSKAREQNRNITANRSSVFSYFK